MRRGVIIVLTLILAGCGRGLPQVTPTVAPSPTSTPGSTLVANVPSQTPIIRLTNTATLTAPATLTFTPTPEATDTPTAPATSTAIISVTPRPTGTPSFTPTPLPPSWTPSFTPTFLPPSATNTPRPTNTPTVTRTLTLTFTPSPTPLPTLTPFISATPSATYTPTVTATLTSTPTPSETPTATHTYTPGPPAPPTLTFTPTVTNTPFPTLTPQSTLTFTPPPPTDTVTLPPPTATFTALPPTETFTQPPPTETSTQPEPTNTPFITRTTVPTLEPTSTPTATDSVPTLFFTPTSARATFTPAPPPLSTNTPPQPSSTPTFDFTASAALQLTLIRQGQLTQTALPSWTPVATNAPTRTLEPQDVTPNVITATPGGPAFPDNVNGITSTPQIVANLATPGTEFPTLVPTPTTLPPEIIQRGFPTPLPAPRYQPYSTTNLATYRFSIQPGTTFAFNGAQVTGGFSQFAPNPAFPGSFAYVDLLGVLHFAPPGGSESPLNESPFFYGFDVPSLQENKNRVRDVGWSPNGQQYFFIVDPGDAAPDKQNAGVWFWQPNDLSGHTFEILVDCLPEYEGFSCNLVQNRPAGYWQSLKAQWSPDSTRVLVTLRLPGENRQALTLVNAVTDNSYKINAPDFIRYDYGYFTPDGRVVVSGRDPDGRVVVALTDGNLANPQVLLDASSANLWMRDAFMRPDGNIVAFGREGDANGPVRLYLIQNGGATALTGDIGTTAPVRIDVADDGRQAVVSVDGTQYTVNASTGSAIATELRLEGYGPPGGFEGTSNYPAGVLPNSRYTPGQQVQMIDSGRRNVRNLPGTGTSVIDYVDPGEYVGILAGPYEADGFTWWYVNTARNQQGWFAGQQGDVSYLNP